MDSHYKVNLIRESMPSYEEYCEKIKVIWDNNWMTNSGVLHDELEKRLCTYLGVDNCLLYTNGHSALEAALQSLQLSGEVITTPFTFLSTTQAIVRSGLSPVFCDIAPDTLTIDPSKIEELITEKTVAILGVHVYGIPCDVGAIASLAKKHNLKVIYDAAHSFGSTLNGKGIGTYGDMSAFSMHATKVFNTAEGGAVTFSNPEYYDNLKNIRNFGFNSRYDANLIGFNAKMSEFHAAVGLCNLNRLSQDIANRKKIYNIYKDALSECNSISMPMYPKGLVSNYPYFPIIISPNSMLSRDELFDILDKEGIQTRKYFYPLTNEFSCFQNKYKDFSVPVARKVSRSVLCLPLYSDLSEESAKTVVHTIKKHLK